jgi:hypothetical protein
VPGGCLRLANKNPAGQTACGIFEHQHKEQVKRRCIVEVISEDFQRAMQLKSIVHPEMLGDRNIGQFQIRCRQPPAAPGMFLKLTSIPQCVSNLAFLGLQAARQIT